MKDIQALYANRFTSKQRRAKEVLWKSLVEFYFSRFIPIDSWVLDVGAGYCEFINTIKADKRFALDLNTDTTKYAAKGVQVIIGEVNKLPRTLKGKLDVIFVSNFLEHLPDRFYVLATLNRLHPYLKEGGKLIILQPNINLAKTRYWDHIDHHIALNEFSLVEAVVSTGYLPVKLIKRFLPLTVQSRLPVHPILIRIYLSLPEWLRPFAGQSLLIATRA